MNENLVEKVRQRYESIAEGKISGCCGVTEDAAAKALGYAPGDVAGLPEAANLGLGCGAPVGRLDLKPGETVLDLGSGPGLDALLAARHVGPAGRVVGVDMTPAMIDRARAAAAEAGTTNVEFRAGRLEALPLPDASVDAVTSNCVINLVPDKAAVFGEVARVLRPGGRLVVSDIVLDGPLPDVLAQDLLAWVGCVAGALPRADYFALVRSAGLDEVRILRDDDYIAQIGCALPPELLSRMSEVGVSVEDLAGKVRSITYRAIRPPV